MTQVPVTPTPLVALSDTQTPSDRMAADDGFEHHWTAWLAKGSAHNARTRRRMTWVAWVAGTGVVTWPAWAPALLNLVVPERS